MTNGPLTLFADGVKTTPTVGMIQDFHVGPLNFAICVNDKLIDKCSE